MREFERGQQQRHVAVNARHIGKRVQHPARLCLRMFEHFRDGADARGRHARVVESFLPLGGAASEQHTREFLLQFTTIAPPFFDIHEPRIRQQAFEPERAAQSVILVILVGAQRDLSFASVIGAGRGTAAGGFVAALLRHVAGAEIVGRIGTHQHECGDGWFVEPTIFTGVKNSMRIAQEEVFGPVLSVIPFKDEEEAIAIGNDVVYGLAAGVWTQNMRRAFLMAEKLQAGTVWVNTYRAVSYLSPFGGYKRSGLGRESGQEMIKEYLQTKSVWISTAKEVPNPFIMR